MKSPFKRFFFVAMVIAAAARGQSPPSAPSFETDYALVLHVMKSPPVTGVLIADVSRGGPADDAGLLAGDIVVEYAGTPVETLRGLQSAVAVGIGVGEADRTASEKVDIKVQREGKGIVKGTIRRGGLAISPVEVVSGVPCDLNPPATAADELTLSWDALPTGRQFIVMRDADGTAQAYTTLTLSRDAGHMECKTQSITRDVTQTFGVTFDPSDGRALPAFLTQIIACDTPWVHYTVERRGSRLVQTGTPEPSLPGTAQSVMTVVPLGCGVLPLASAMPQEKDRVFAFSGVDPLTLQTQPGWALVTKGQEPVKVAGVEKKLWGVQAMRLGRVQMTWWFDEQRRLMVIAAAGLRGEEVSTELAAKAAIARGKQP